MNKLRFLGTSVLNGQEKDYVFTKNPSKLKGARHIASIEKGSRGFGFTIVGGDDPEEFLQVKEVVSGGPASRSENVRQGNLLEKRKTFFNSGASLYANHSTL